MRRLIILFMLLGTVMAENRPEWIHNPDKSCKKSELCAVGIGPGLALASADARAGIAKIFEARVQSTFKQTTTSDNVGEDQLYLSSEIKETVDEVLNGVVIRESYEGEQDVYALGVLDKNKAAAGLKQEIDKIDEQMKVLAADQSLSSSQKLKRLFKKRIPLNARFQVLKGQGLDAPIKYQTVFDNIKKALQGVVVAVKVDSEGNADIAKNVVSVLGDLDYKVVEWAQSGVRFTHIVLVELKREKQFLNVKGFVKYRFVLNLSALNNQGQKTGSLQFDTVMIGRTERHAYDQVVPQIKDYINKNLDSLNIE